MSGGRIARSFEILHAYLRAAAYKGYEFDDLLGSRIVRVGTLGIPLLQRIAIQVGRRSILNFRPLIGVKRLESAKARGFFAKGYLYYFLATGDDDWLDAATEHLEWLLQNRSSRFSGMSWGNAFDFASRGGFIPEGLPTIVWSAHISEAFYLAYQCTGVAKYRDAVLGVGVFVRDCVGRLQDDTGVCLGYTPGGSSPIHNSNLLGAAALLRAWYHSGDTSFYRLAVKAIDWSCARMSPDGSWYYGDDPKYRWIDNFHTAYNLDSLVTAQDLAGPDVVKNAVIDCTYRYWVERFFLRNGTPRYYHDRTYPIDIQCSSQAIESLSKYSIRDHAALELAVRVAAWTIRNMQKSNGAFAFRKGRILLNRLESIHWGESTMLSALGCLLLHLETKRNRTQRLGRLPDAR